MKQMWKALGVSVLMFLVYMLPSVGMGLVLPLAMDPSDDVRVLLRDGVPTLCMVLAALGLWAWAKQQRLWQGHYWGLSAKELGLLVLVFVLMQAWVMAWGQFKGDMTDNDAAVMELFELFPLWMMVGFVCLVAPVCEEIIFRGMLMGKVFAQHMLWGMLVSTVLFAAIHMPEDVVAWLMYGGLGFAFSWLYWKTKRLWLCVLLHMANNALAVAEMQSWLG